MIRSEKLDETLKLIEQVWYIINTNYVPKRKFKGPIMLSRFYRWVDWRENKELNLKLKKLCLCLKEIRVL